MIEVTTGDVNEVAQQLAKELAQQLGQVAKRLAPRYAIELWPAGAPARLTWEVVFRGYMARLDRVADAAVEADVR